MLCLLLDLLSSFLKFPHLRCWGFAFWVFCDIVIWSALTYPTPRRMTLWHCSLPCYPDSLGFTDMATFTTLCCVSIYFFETVHHLLLNNFLTYYLLELIFFYYSFSLFNLLVWFPLIIHLSCTRPFFLFPCEMGREFLSTLLFYPFYPAKGDWYLKRLYQRLCSYRKKEKSQRSNGFLNGRIIFLSKILKIDPVSIL